MYSFGCIREFNVSLRYLDRLHQRLSALAVHRMKCSIISLTGICTKNSKYLLLLPDRVTIDNDCPDASRSTDVSIGAQVCTRPAGLAKRALE